jgi:predicted HTH transcriptional regulator
LVVGVAEGGKLVGLDNPEQTRRLLDRAAEAVHPRVNMQSEIVTLDGKLVLVAEVSAGELAPYLVHGQALQRKVDATVSDADETREKRRHFLRAVYDLANGTSSKPVRGKDVAQQLGMDIRACANRQAAYVSRSSQMAVQSP